jgi:hypothetical protein
MTKNVSSAAQSSGRVKIFCSEQQQVRAAVKRIRGEVIQEHQERRSADVPIRKQVT